jgi:hypothetical protein
VAELARKWLARDRVKESKKLKAAKKRKQASKVKKLKALIKAL